MTQPPPPAPPTASPGRVVPFWHPDAASYTPIKEVYILPTDHPHEDIVWFVWEDILHLNFLSQAEIPGGQRWHVRREPYRGQSLGKPPKIRPDIITLKSTPGPPGVLVRDELRDYLWVECKAPSYDKPWGWKEVLLEAAGRLAYAHATRDVFLMIAIGRRCAYFIWDPQNTMPPQPQLSIVSANDKVTWYIDSRIKTLGSSRWVNTKGEIDIAQLLELECLETETVGDQVVLRNRVALAEIQRFLDHVKITPLQGFNPM